MKKILIIAGEISGDIHAASFIKEVLKQDQNLQFCAIGGQRMKRSGAKILLDMDSMTTMGFVAPVLNILNYRRILKYISDWMRENKPEAVILVDFPGFNLQIACKAAHLGIPVVYYILPQVWAWGAWRIHEIRRYVKLALVIFPFVSKYLEQYGIDSTYVGHPILDSIEKYKTEDITLPWKDKNIVGIFPGSRKSEIKRHLKIMIEAAERIHSKNEEVKFLIACSEEYKPYSGVRDYIYFLSGKSYEIMNISDILIVASGTVTLEGAYYQKPMIVIYRTEFITYFLAKILAKVKFISLVNLIAGEIVIPELIQKNATSERIFHLIEKILYSKQYKDKMVKKIIKVKMKLGSPGASRRAAKEFLSFLYEAER